MVNCVVKNCGINSANKGPGISFFSFPLKDPERLKVWISFTGRENWTPSKYSKICSLHFMESNFSPGCLPRKLKSYAMPSILPLPFANGLGNVNVGKVTSPTQLSTSSICTTSDSKIRVVTSVNMAQTEIQQLKKQQTVMNVLEREMAKKDKKIATLQKKLCDAKKKKSNGNRYMWLPKERSLWPLLFRK